MIFYSIKYNISYITITSPACITQLKPNINKIIKIKFNLGLIIVNTVLQRPYPVIIESKNTASLLRTVSNNTLQGKTNNVPHRSNALFCFSDDKAGNNYSVFD